MSDEPSAEAPPSEPGPVAIASGRDAEALQDEILLLSAMGIPHALRPVVPVEPLSNDGSELGVELVVAPAHADQAVRELRGLERPAVPPAGPALLDGARAGLPAAVALLAVHALLMVLPEARRAAIYAAGALDAARLHHGELWRAATALTLHADPAHVIGNAVATAIFISAAGDWVGPGVALACTILAGVFGNLAAALIDPGHHAIGFSTATFGALGLTAVFGFVARYRDRLERRRAWLALGAGLALLALLGAGERSDVLAHVFGLVAGVLIGLAVARSGPLHVRRPIEVSTAGQAAAAILSLGLLVGAWLWALS